MCFFRDSLLEGIVTKKEYEEIENKAAKRCNIPKNSVYRLLIKQIK